MAGHFVALAAFLVQPHPQPPAFACRHPRPSWRARRRCGRRYTPSAPISARSRRPDRRRRCRCCRAARRASAGSSTGVLPLRTMCCGPRTEAAGLTGTIWPITSQSKRWRIAARRCFTVGADASRRSAPRSRSPTCSGCTPARERTPCPSHQARNSPTARLRPAACAVADLRGEELQEAQPGGSPAAAMAAGMEAAEAARATSARAISVQRVRARKLLVARIHQVTVMIGVSSISAATSMLLERFPPPRLFSRFW